MVGYVIGRGGEHINNIQTNCGVRLQFQNGTQSHTEPVPPVMVSPNKDTLKHYSAWEKLPL